MSDEPDPAMAEFFELLRSLPELQPRDGFAERVWAKVQRLIRARGGTNA